MKRRRMERRESRRNFSRNAQRVHPRNTLSSGISGPMRGGIRL